MLLQNCFDKTQLRQIPARAVYCMLLQNCCDRTKIRQIPVACFSRIVSKQRFIRYQLEQCTTLCMLLQNCCGRKKKKKIRQIPARPVYCTLHIIMPLQNCCDRTEIRQIPVVCFSRFVVTEQRSARYQLCASPELL